MSDTILRIIDIIAYGTWLSLFPLTLILGIHKNLKEGRRWWQ
jgi:hypothetical protein